MCLRILLLPLMLSVALPLGVAAGTTVDTLEEWGESVAMDPRVTSEMVRFVHDGEALGDEYARSLADALRKRLFDAAAARLAAYDPGETVVEVEFPDPGFATRMAEDALHDSEREFEDGFMRIELIAFVPCEGVTPEEALRVYTSSDFRKQMSSRTRRIWIEGDDSCVETTKKTFAPAMLSCNRITEIHEEGFSAQHAQVVSNPGEGDHQAVYFKESLKTFVAVPGGLVVHYINYSRSKRVSRIARDMVRGKIKGAQEDAIVLLGEKLCGRD